VQFSKRKAVIWCYRNSEFK